MTNSKHPEREKAGAPKPAKTVVPGPAAKPLKVAPLFRRIDWIAMLMSFGLVWVVYFLTVAPELTLEDSGELVTGSFYAGIPHPPGYPVWTIWSWLWTALVPVGNPAWRVALAQATTGALACGLLSLMVSRGSSMFMESIEELKSMTGKWESGICLVAGLVSGLLLGWDGFMWKESVAVNRIAVSSVPWFLLVLVCLLRWLYAPHQVKYIYLALFIFGVCFTTHQSLIVAGIGVQVAIAAGNMRLGRDVFFIDFVFFVLYYCYYWSTGQHLFPNIGAKPGLFVLFNMIMVATLAASWWLAIKTRTKGDEVARNLALAGVLIGLVLTVLNRGNGTALFVFAATAGSLWMLVKLARKTWRFGHEWLQVLILGLLWVAGASFYIYMPISGMTNPPMQWGYPRTVEGFWHALSRGQYEQPNPTNLLTEPTRFVNQLGMLISGVADEFTWVYIFIALVPFIFFFRMQKREQAWLISLAAIYFCLGVLLVILLNPTPDRASADLVKVFFNNSHTVVAGLIGYGLALVAAFMATHYQRFRMWGLIGGGVAVVLAFIALYDATGKHFFGPAGTGMTVGMLPHWVAQAFKPNQFGLPIIANLLLVAIPIGFIIALLVYKNRAPLLITLGLFGAMPLYSLMDHWYASDQRNHWFGYWFGHDMFTPPFKGADGKPIYPTMTKDAILYGGTDPGRFCPTYMIFCESFIPGHCQPAEDQNFDRRDVYIITQNALADGTYLNYIRAHYNRSTQIDPPFFQQLFRSAKEKELNYTTNIFARMVSPLDRFFGNIGQRVEKQRRTYTSWLSEGEFKDLKGFAAALRTGANQDPLAKYLHDNLSEETRQLLAKEGAEETLRTKLAVDLNKLLERELTVRDQIREVQEKKAKVDQKLASGKRSESLAREQAELGKELDRLTAIGPLYETNRFSHVQLSDYLKDFIKENPQSHTRIRLNRLLLEAAYPNFIATSIGGVYPDREMYIATPEDSQKCFNDYLQDAQRRLEHDARFPNEPRQIRPGEDVRIVENRVTVAGQVAVMAINGLLTKVMFDANPKNEFFVEESFPLDWMYPHLTPYGIIMKINRQPLGSLSEEVLKKDHDFWKQYSKRLTGDIIDYDTPLKDIADWIEKRYLRRNFEGFTGDRKFIHDDDGQKAFSKLRSSIGGIYAWRLNPGCPPQFRPKNDAEQLLLYKEADFTFKQAFAFCPYSPEAVFRYVNLLLQFQRIDDALIVARTCEKLDPYNGQVKMLVSNLEQIRSSTQRIGQAPAKPELPTQPDLATLDQEVRTSGSNANAAVELAKIYLQLQQTGRAVQLLDGVLSNTTAEPGAVVRAAMLYGDIQDWPKLEASLEKLVKVSPGSPEAWYDLAGLKANLRKNDEALPALRTALALSSQRLQTNPEARNLLTDLKNDYRFSGLRQTAEYQKLVVSN